VSPAGAAGALREIMLRLDALRDATTASQHVDQPDLRDGSVYVCPPGLVTAVKVALVTGRPLLLYGAPGTGKSSLGAYLARNLNWRYYEHVVTARTEARDLLWRFDLVQRLADANAGPAEPLRNEDYVEPGPLWWAIDPDTARLRGAPADRPPSRPARDPQMTAHESRDPAGAVLLIDEIDKADPDVPNALLIPLGSLRFRVTDIDVDVQASPGPGPEGTPRRLVVLTTNEERDLPAAFLRRCITLRLELPDAVTLARIAVSHLEAEGRVVSSEDRDRIDALAQRLERERPARPAPGEHVPGTAEFLDAVRAHLALDHLLSPADRDLVEGLTLVKPTSVQEG